VHVYHYKDDGPLNWPGRAVTVARLVTMLACSGSGTLILDQVVQSVSWRLVQPNQRWHDCIFINNEDFIRSVWQCALGYRELIRNLNGLILSRGLVLFNCMTKETEKHYWNTPMLCCIDIQLYYMFLHKLQNDGRLYRASVPLNTNWVYTCVLWSPIALSGSSSIILYNFSWTTVLTNLTGNARETQHRFCTDFRSWCGNLQALDSASITSEPK